MLLDFRSHPAAEARVLDMQTIGLSSKQLGHNRRSSTVWIKRVAPCRTGVMKGNFQLGPFVIGDPFACFIAAAL
jgi:hypothetical protein